jgi:hypothetical protein
MAVLDAFLNGCICNSTDNNVAFEADRNGLAAALRAVADQVVPEESEPSEQPFADLNDRWPIWNANQKTRRKLLAIATELEAPTDQEIEVGGPWEWGQR